MHSRTRSNKGQRTIFLFAGLLLALMVTGLLPALAQETLYRDPAGLFTATIPDGWSDESTAEYGLFTHSGVSIYLLSVDGSDVQASIAAALARIAPEMVDASSSVAVDFEAPSGTWTQVIYNLPDGRVANAVAQSNGSATAVLLVTAESI